jgi:predicted lipoprotein with Yx(FWY)xxD motif
MRGTRIAIAAAALGTATLLAGIGGAGATADEMRASAAKAKKKTKLEVHETGFGNILFAGNDRVLYMFTSDGGSGSNCSGECAAAWPPFIARGKLVGGPGVNRKLLGRTTRTDGRKQVTYNGHPLYFYIHDGRNEILCHNVFEFGGDWKVVRKSGNPAP